MTCNQETEYIVVCGHTLGYRLPDGLSYGVLHASVLRGAIWSLYPGPKLLPTNPADVRPATSQDFEDFRVWEPPDFEEGT